MRNTVMALGFVAAFLPNLAFAESLLVVSYDEAYQGSVSVNGQTIGTLISHGVYNEVSEAAKKGGGADKKAILKEKTRADKAGLNGMGSNLMMDFEVEYGLDKYLKVGENQITITFTGYTNPQAATFGYQGRGPKGPNKLEAKIWDVNGDNVDLLSYRMHVTKPTKNSTFGSEMTPEKLETMTLTITKK